MLIEAAGSFQEEYPIGPQSFKYKPFFTFNLFGSQVEVTRIITLAFFAVLVLSVFFLWALRHPKLIPGRTQFAAESVYQFIRNQVARDVIGAEGVRFASYLTTLFVFIFLLNLYEIIPLIQVPVTGRISFPAFLAAITLVLFIWQGVKTKGTGYFKQVLFPPGVPKALYFLLTPIEFFSTFLVRPFTLAVRLFANMFAGHLLVLIFFSGALYMWSQGGFYYASGFFSFLVGIIVTFFELLIISLQAYIFVILTSVYVSESIAEDH